MNIKAIIHNLGTILKIEGTLLLLPLIVSLIYKENTFLSFLIPSGISVAIGYLLTFKRKKNMTLNGKESFMFVGLTWILMSLIGAIPFVISRQIPSYIDALFETVSGFTTTGASILDPSALLSDAGNVNLLTHSMLFWRSFSHFIGGLGVVVFALAILPKNNEKSINFLKAESTGPTVGKIVSKTQVTARILYLMYLAMFSLEVILLLLSKMPLFDAICLSFGTAGTGGFSIYASGFATLSKLQLTIIAIFMLIFGINFNIFFLLISRKIKDAIKDEEMHWYFIIIVLATIFIGLNVYLVNKQVDFFNAFFTVSSIITTTGYTTIDYTMWPLASQIIILILMFIGGCAGSTAGGIKVSRIALLIKSSPNEIKKIARPNLITNTYFNGKVVNEKVLSNIKNYFVTIIVILLVATLLISFDPYAGKDFVTSLSACATCLNNVGPGLGFVGPSFNFSEISTLGKILLILLMLLGRLELYPIMIFFSPSTFKR